ncbi:hypothetical protein FHS82_003770 [Pseudochelatococcus lubricantis]|uniref:DUF3108 domain-containing protein n=1 Tax=Pseudochelatococcus lubricantis TaxID=1538102 RepID=A0ABX0V5Y6_9HYPH|nr:DUF3108 domain-containing protein [Pseudochelatococcus lubricantis]NIJ59909.1 hypothetical protein [Pseudochelatococcus lubricantis]
MTALAARLAAAGILASPCAALPAWAAEADSGGAFESRYDITLMGMQVGVAQLKASVAGDRYKVELWTRLTGLAGVMTGGKGAASSSGTVAGAMVRPAKFAVTTASGDRSVSVRMALADGAVRALKVSPPIPERKQRIPLREGDMRDIVDPVSALLMPVAGSVAAGDPAACNRTLPLFDGSARFDVPLSFVRAQKINGRAYAGTIAICSGRYKPISGHVPGRPDTDFMENNRDIEVWLAPAVEGRLFLPYRISVRSPLGLVVIEATRFPGGLPDTAPQRTPGPALRASN